MDKRSWPWKKKSSDKSTTAVPLFDSDTVHADSARSKIEQEREEEAKKPKYVQVSMDTYAHLTGLEDQVKSYEEKFQCLEEEIKDLNEKLSESHIEITNKDILVKQHGKVAEEAVSGWEKAEAEAAALKNHLESVTLLKITAEDRASHLDGALKECMRQIRNLKEEHELKLFDVMTNNTKQFEKIKIEFESKIADLDRDLMRSAAENAALSRSLQDRSSMLIRINEEKSQAEAEIEQLKCNIESCHKEMNSLTYELHIVAKEMEIRNEEKNMSVRSAEVANKQYSEGVKKIAKLEAECQRLRGLVRKKLPGPAALAQMKLEVENFGRDHGDNIRFRRSAPKPSALLPEFSFDAVQNCHKENELLTERLVEMEEETKMLKEALAKRNSELQASRSVYSKTANKLQCLEAQLQDNGGHRSPPSLTSISIDDNISCDGSSATGMNMDTRHKSENTNHLELMDDFLEMEKLAYQSVDMDVVAVSGSTTSNTETYEIARNDSSENVTRVEELGSEEHIGSDLPVICLLSEGENPELSSNIVRNLQSKLIVITDSLSKEADLRKALEELKQVLQEANEAPSDCENGGELTAETAIISSFDDNNETTLSFSQELASSITHIHDFVMVLGEGIKADPTTCNDSEDLSQIITDFSTTYKEVDDSKISLIQYVSDLSQVLHKAKGFYCEFLGYKISEAENANSDCIDKVVLPENKGLQDSSGGDRYQIQNLDFSDSNSETDIPREGSPIRPTELTANLSKHTQEEFEQIVSEKNRLTIDLSTCIENLENTKIQLLDTERELSEAKSELSSAYKLNSLSETQLKCMAESYKTLETRAEELQAEVNLLHTQIEGFHNELQEEKKNHQDALSRCSSLEDQLQKMESCQFSDIDSRTNQERELGDAAAKLAQCQETIHLLGKQLKAMRPNTEATTPTDRHKEGDIIEQVVSNMNHQGMMNTEVTGPNVRESPMNLYDVPYSPDTTTTTTTTTEGNNSLYLRSPNNSNSPKHRYASNSSFPSSPILEKEKHSRGFTRFFSAKSKNGF